jgi:dihydrofolate reductase
VSPKRFKAIAAMSENRVIGAHNRIPWHLPEDFRWFKRMTTGQIVVMGRKTFESIGKPLPNRTTIVLSRSRHPIADVRVIGSLAELDPAREEQDIFVCGGAEVYAQALTFCSDLYLTLVKRWVAGDTFFPPFEHLFDPAEIILDQPEFRITHYRRRSEVPCPGD